MYIYANTIMKNYFFILNFLSYNYDERVLDYVKMGLK